MSHSLPEAPWPVVGVDVAKASLEVCLLTEPRQRCTVANHPKGHQQLFAWLQGHGISQALLAMEATGPYGLALAASAYAAGYRVAVLNPRDVAGFCQQKRRQNKTDRTDAEFIARYAQEDARHDTLPLWQPLPPAQAKLRALLRRQAELKTRRHAEKCRLDEETEPLIRESLKRSLASLDRELKELERGLREHLKASPALQADVALLQTIPGVGLLSARWLAAELPRHFRNGRTVAAWLSVVPCQEHSGTSVHRPGHVAFTAPELRPRLFFVGMTNMRRDPRVQPFVERLKAKGKAPKSIILALLNKLIRAAFAMLKHQLPYDVAHVYQRHQPAAPRPALAPLEPTLVA